jgi:hypothetical protein
MLSVKKFRFDSFASEFASKEETSVTTTTTTTATALDQTTDNDSGIGESMFFLFYKFEVQPNDLKDKTPC